jgi:hypothetical protein
VRRRVEYHRDGSVRMDYLTFCDLKVDQIMSTLKRRPVIIIDRKNLTPFPAVGTLREFK